MILKIKGGEEPLSSPSPQKMNPKLEASFPIDDTTIQQIYLETWLSPAAFDRIWEADEEIPIRFHIDIDIVEQYNL